jgi:hypothetical protein
MSGRPHLLGFSTPSAWPNRVGRPPGESSIRSAAAELLGGARRATFPNASLQASCHRARRRQLLTYPYRRDRARSMPTEIYFRWRRLPTSAGTRSVSATRSRHARISPGIFYYTAPREGLLSKYALALMFVDHLSESSAPSSWPNRVGRPPRPLGALPPDDRSSAGSRSGCRDVDRARRPRRRARAPRNGGRFQIL